MGKQRQREQDRQIHSKTDPLRMRGTTRKVQTDETTTKQRSEQTQIQKQTDNLTHTNKDKQCNRQTDTFSPCFSVPLYQNNSIVLMNLIPSKLPFLAPFLFSHSFTFLRSSDCIPSFFPTLSSFMDSSDSMTSLPSFFPSHSSVYFTSLSSSFQLSFFPPLHRDTK